MTATSGAPLPNDLSPKAAARNGVPSRKRGPSLARSLASLVGYLLLVGVAATFALPFIWAVSTSLKQEGLVFVMPPQWIPDPVVWSNFREAMTTVPFGRYILNTIVIAVVATAGATLTSGMAAFAFARLRFPGKEMLFNVVIATLMLPGVVLQVPHYVIFAKLHWVDTFLPLTVPAWFGGGAFNIFLIRQYLSSVPLDLDEAARLDGASTYSILWRVIMPLAKPSLAAVGVFSIVNRWNDFFGPLLYLHNPLKKTVSIGLKSFQDQFSTQWTLTMAATIATMLPVLLFYFVAQRYFIQGIAVTGLAGR